MAEPSLDFIGRQLQSIQAELRQLKFATDIDRTDATSRHNNLIAAVGIKIGAFEATIEQRIETLEGHLEGHTEQRLDALRDELIERLDRIERLVSKT